jgi:hypothetical protein
VTLYHTPEPVTIKQAIAKGLAWVYGPFLPLLIGIPLLLIFAVLVMGTVADLPSWLMNSVYLLALFFAIAAPWLWWSYSVPKWRLWAYERVENIPELIEEAVAVGLIWPPGHFFEKTEIKSKEHAAKEKEWEAKKS